MGYFVPLVQNGEFYKCYIHVRQNVALRLDDEDALVHNYCTCTTTDKNKLLN